MQINKKNHPHNYQHGPQQKIGVLLVNLGSPNTPRPAAVRKYLAEFLWDPRIVEMPRPLWWLILHGYILRRRPAASAKLYQRIWTEQGSPLIAYTMQQAQLLEKQLAEKLNGNMLVDVAMRYGKPSIKQGLDRLRKAGAQRLLILPLYPQYSATTTASVFDAVTDELRQWRWIPEIRFINSYHDHPGYIEALAKSVLSHWNERGRKPDILLFSFHGIPKSFVEKGDPYYCHCQKTARLVAEKLLLTEIQWKVVFQSRMGREEWLQPYCDNTLKQLAYSGGKTIDVICPGFSADCLETLEEINIENRQIFLDRGGRDFSYIAALNDSTEHINALYDLVVQHCSGWPEIAQDRDASKCAVEADKTRERARKMGADS
jgi:ferrochelatase